MRIVLNILGLLFVALGIIGMFLPVMPTTVFWIIAAVIFARSNPEWERRIMAHPKFGPPIKAFRERGVIGRTAKIAAVGGMTVSSLIGFFTLRGVWMWVPAGVCALCALYVLSRPSE
ncbi:YbaN family protein [Asticcacaulis sp. BYS171W]|uniref:YbaN family protein n=1 Tax=Asticcacaulis aquaticus TaxID=2984212 RepID=A0ABT5HPI1_9CAUL|nr:YbaN family protein [Asticcacaulis aquaticus]MDC7681975.1 YbaN family protein [Asticcacaulis aquaticus]